MVEFMSDVDEIEARTGVKPKYRKLQDPVTRGKFLDAILDGNSIRAAAAIVDVDHTTVKSERGTDSEFNRQVTDAIEIRGDISGGQLKLTDEVKAQVVEDVKTRNIRPIIAAASAGIAESTLLKGRHQDPDFDHALLAAERHSVAKVEDTLYKTALKGNVRACETILYNRSPDRWAAPRTLERRASRVEQQAHEKIDADAAADGKELTLAEKQSLVQDLLADIANRTPNSSE